MNGSSSASFGGATGKASIGLKGNNPNVKGSKLGSYKEPTHEDRASIGQALGGVVQQWATTVPGFGAMAGMAGLGGASGPSPISGLDSIGKLFGGLGGSKESQKDDQVAEADPEDGEDPEEDEAPETEKT